MSDHRYILWLALVACSSPLTEVEVAWADTSCCPLYGAIDFLPVVLADAESHAGVPNAIETTSRPAGIRQQRSAQLNRDLFAPHMLGTADDAIQGLSIELFDGETQNFRIVQREHRSPTSYTLLGAPVDRPHTPMVLSYEQGALTAWIKDASGELIEVHAGPETDTTMMVARSPDSFLPCGGGLSPPAPSAPRQPTTVSMAEDWGPLSTGTLTVDVAIVYTDLARSDAGGDAAIRSEIHSAIAQANLVNSNSDVNLVYRPVYIGRVDYFEADSITDLMRITDNDGLFMSEVHCVRDHYGADLVQLVVSTVEVGGLAWIMCDLVSDYSDNGFSLVAQSALSQYVMAHELGHNFGCDHDSDNLSDCRVQDYAMGYRFNWSFHQFRTVMAYLPGQTIPNFSNPDVIYPSNGGLPTGVTDEIDNARVMRDNASIVAAYRPTLYPRVPPPPSNVAVVPVQSNVVRVSWQACGATGYEIRRDGVPVGTTANTWFEDVEVPPGSERCWTVVATNQHGASSVSASACLSVPALPQFVLNGTIQHPTYLHADPGMTLYAAVRGTELYVATWSTGIFPDDSTRNDHFLFVTDALLPSASANAPWDKSGQVAVAANTPFVGAESKGDFVGWFNAPASAQVMKSPFNQRKMEGVIDLVEAFGAMPGVIYLAAAAYNTEDGGALVAQAPAGSGPDIEPHEFLKLYTEAIRDEWGNGIFDRLDPQRDFVTHEIESNVGGVTLVWAAVPGQAYRIEFADPPNTGWQAGPQLTAGVDDLALTWTDNNTAPATRVYRVRLD